MKRFNRAAVDGQARLIDEYAAATKNGTQPHPSPPGNRRQRRANQSITRGVNKALNKQINHAKGPVSVTIGPDGVPHVVVTKQKGPAPDQVIADDPMKEPAPAPTSPSEEPEG